MKLEKQRVILTGAAGGMGSILANLIADAGAEIALIDANAESLQKLAATIDGSHAVPGDLCNEAGCNAAIHSAMQALGGVDVLINLAGLMSFSTYEDEDIKRIQLLMQVNLIAPMILSRAALPVMLKQGKGQIVNVGSTFGSDEPDAVAKKIFKAIESGKKEAYFGYPESIFARINGLLPGLVDNGTKAQNRIARSFAKPG
jgi:short-subunit dehydrogenase